MTTFFCSNSASKQYVQCRQIRKSTFSTCYFETHAQFLVISQYLEICRTSAFLSADQFWFFAWLLALLLLPCVSLDNLFSRIIPGFHSKLSGKVTMLKSIEMLWARSARLWYANLVLLERTVKATAKRAGLLNTRRSRTRIYWAASQTYSLQEQCKRLLRQCV